MPLRRLALALLPAVALVGVAGWELIATVRQDAHVEADADWAAARADVRAQFQPGDLVVFAPGWIDPVGRQHLGDLMSVDDAARMDAARFPRIWQVAIRGAQAPEVAQLHPVARRRHGGVEVALYEQPAVTITATALAALPTAVVAGDRARGPSSELAEVGFAPHRCIQVVPQPGKAVRITLPAFALGTQLVGYVGLADVFTRRDVRDPGRLDVEIAGQVVASTTVGVDDGWVRFAAPTTPGPTDVIFIATAVGPRSRDRLICFAAEARR